MQLDEKLLFHKIVDTKTISNQITVYISGMIGPPENYIEVIDTIRNASENDVIKININSPGGDLFTTIQLLRAITETNAFVVTSAEGACMSAATMIFLSADHYEISDHCLFMFHNYSGASVGKGGEMYDQLINERKWSENIIRNVYGGFLTDDEIKGVLNNKDIWMEGKEVIKRLEKRIKETQEAASAQQKKTRTKKTKTTAEQQQQSQ